MPWLLTTIGGFIVAIVEWLVKRLTVPAVLMGMVGSLYISFVIFLISFFSFAIDYILRFYKAFKVVISKLFEYGSASGSYGGVSSSTIVDSIMAFLHASGIATAFETAIDLFFSYLSLYLIYMTYMLIIHIKNSILQTVSSSIQTIK